MKKLIRLLVCLMILTTLNSKNVSAEDNNSIIPDEMQPYSEIVFTSDTTYEIIKGGHVQDKTIITLEISDSFKYADESNVSTEIIIPKKGMKVIYGSDGFIFDIICESNVYQNITQTTKTRGSAVPPLSELVLFATWGSYPNKLYYIVVEDSIYGVGRATTYSDAQGQGNHVSVKGDVATKLAYDNCKLGIEVDVITKNSSGINYEKTMHKWNVGGMPNAVLDIWKTGVEYWGYTWSSTFSMPKQVTYSHDNIDVNGNPIFEY